MATLASLTQDVLNRIYGTNPSWRPAIDTLNGAINSSVTALQVDTEAMWKRGDQAEFDNNEIVEFMADASGSTTILRARRGTTAQSQSDGATMTKNPPFPRDQVEEAITEVVEQELWPKVWTWHQGTVSWATGTYTYALPAYIEEVARVFQYDLNGNARFYDIPRTMWEVEKQIPSGIVTNELALRLHWVHDDSATVYYTGMRRPYIADIANQSDDVARLIVVGALWKLEAHILAYAMAQNPTRQDRDSGGDPFKLYRGFGADFLRARASLNRSLRGDVKRERIFRRTEFRSKVW